MDNIDRDSEPDDLRSPRPGSAAIASAVLVLPHLEDLCNKMRWRRNSPQHPTPVTGEPLYQPAKRGRQRRCQHHIFDEPVTALT